MADAAGRLQALTLFVSVQHRAGGKATVRIHFAGGAATLTDASDLGVTIRGVPFPHLLFEWVLSYSGWTYVALIKR